MIKVITIFIAFVLLTSCAYNRSTIYSNKEIVIGTNKTDVIKKYGNPFKEDLLKEKNGITEILCYKENVYVGAYEYIVSTFFYFKNSKLIKKVQKEEVPPYELNIESKKK